eukprot:444357-Amphidinium_carterae.1
MAAEGMGSQSEARRRTRSSQGHPPPLQAEHRPATKVRCAWPDRTDSGPAETLRGGPPHRYPSNKTTLHHQQAAPAHELAPCSTAPQQD